MKTDVSSVVGPSDETHWGQAITMPGAYGVVEVESTNAAAVGIGVLTKLSDLLKEPPVSLQGIRDIAHEVMSTQIRTLILLVPVGGVVYIASLGAGAVYLKRGNSVSRLLSGTGALSGEIKDDDTILLVSVSMMQAISEENLMNVFDAESLTIILHKAQNDVGCSALIFHNRREESELPIHAVKPHERVMIPRWKKRKIPIIPLILLTLFAGSVMFGIVKKGKESGNRELQIAISEASHAFEEGVALLDLNPVKGRERLARAKEILEPFHKEKEVVDLYGRIIDNLTLAQHSVRQEPMVFFDAALVKSGGVVQTMSLFEDSFGLFDATNRSLYTLDISSKRSDIVGGGQQTQGVTHIAVYSDKIYLLTKTGISLVRISDKKATPDVISKSDSWGTIASLVAYGGNLYLLDTQKSRIWKYVAPEKGLPAGRQGFSELREYLNPDTLPDLSKATGLSIDGSVWVGTSDGKIFRFVQGKEQTFLPQGVEPGFGQFLVVYTSDLTKNLYILDADNKRVVVLDKDGMYLAQYMWEGAFTPTHIAVSEKEKKIFLLSEGKIYFVELK